MFSVVSKYSLPVVEFKSYFAIYSISFNLASEYSLEVGFVWKRRLISAYLSLILLDDSYIVVRSFDVGSTIFFSDSRYLGFSLTFEKSILNSSAVESVPIK